MEITRRQITAMFERNYCPRCGKVTEMDRTSTGLPRIQCKKCLTCNGYYYCNFLEDEDDILQCPDDFVIDTS